MQINGSAFQAGLSSIQAGQRVATQAAGEIAAVSATGAPIMNEDLTTQLLQLDLGRQQVESASKVISAADSTLGSLIDVHA